MDELATGISEHDRSAIDGAEGVAGDLLALVHDDRGVASNLTDSESTSRPVDGGADELHGKWRRHKGTYAHRGRSGRATIGVEGIVIERVGDVDGLDESGAQGLVRAALLR